MQPIGSARARIHSRPGARHSGAADCRARAGGGSLFNVTQDKVLRFLPPFLLEEKHVDKGIRVLKKLLGKKRRKGIEAETNLATAR